MMGATTLRDLIRILTTTSALAAIGNGDVTLQGTTSIVSRRALVGGEGFEPPTLSV